MDLNAGRSLSAGTSPPGDWPTPRSAYVHVPFCRHRCGYCNFSVVAGRDDLIERFLRAIDNELAALERPRVSSVYVGGGTPTHLSPVQLEALLVNLGERFQFEAEVEWSIEANPEDITIEKLDLLARHGVNRISLGVQSFDDRKLAALQRGHSGESARRAVEASATRIGNVSIDMIFAAPEETLEGWKDDLDTAMTLPIRHLSTYALTIEKGTSFWSRHHRADLHPPDESVEVEMYSLGREVTAAAGFRHYEISNFAAAGFQSKHNLAYWDGQGWFAAGPGAARFVDGRREVNHRSTTSYLRRMESGHDPTAERESISTGQYARERAAFGVRRIEGIDLDAISAQTGIDLWELCGEAIDQSVAEDLLVREGDHRIRLTDRGILFADTVASRLLG
jgi:oxygen-independent coproporphyrinogen-3 oxidase